MIYQAIFLPLAKQDVKQAALWYNKKQKRLGRRFTTEVRQKVKFICKNPEAVALRYEDVRTALVHPFPYAIHYIIEKDAQKIVITAVMHSSQNPNLWEDRR